MSTRMWAWIVTVFAFALAPHGAVAQEEPDDSSSDETVDDAPAESAQPSDPLEDARALGGDVIIMESGAIMGGVQVLRSTTRVYEIQVVEGAEPLVIPRRQVRSVELDDYDPLREARRKARNPEPEVKLMVDDAQEVSPELTEKLMAPIPGMPKKYENQDYAKIYQEIGNAADVQIVVDQSLLAGRPKSRHWTIEVPEDLKLAELLQEKWLPAFPDGKIKYELNRVVLHKKDVEPQPVSDAPGATPPAGNAQINFGN